MLNDGLCGLDFDSAFLNRPVCTYMACFKCYTMRTYMACCWKDVCG